ncbi:DUF1574 family protein [Leptospira biflexa]|uniref:DUF1574 family protein n=1 Tax=Leptospira biflexa TaxID=172 RepID=UPI00108471DC|nr:DUF1574 family protein [Leptospira biflexa]TGM37660.1 DUF1574 domain-containing protein [Leptospira biflexa]TGM40996.1 DUF1574 domain-containing protein [Leptospira biflexa]
MKLKKFRILYLFLLFFAIDKLVLIPSVRAFLTSEEVGNPYIESFKNLNADYLNDDRYKDKKKIWAFGTSRSFSFYQYASIPYIQNSEYISNQQKKELENYKVYTFAAPGSNPLIYFTRFNQLLEQNYKPDLVFLEVSAFSFNKNNRFTNITLLEGVPLEFAMAHFNELPNDFAKEYFFSRIFSLSRYKISTKAISANIFGTKDKNMEMLKNFLPANSGSVDPFASAFDTKTNREEYPYSPNNFNDFKNYPNNDMDKYVKVSMLVDVLKKEFYGNFTDNHNNFQFLSNIINRCQKEKIPVVLWIPKVHKELNDFYHSATFYPQWKMKIQTLAEQKGIRFIDLNEDGKIKCDYFNDAAHISGRCLPEIEANVLGIPK